LTEAEAAPSWRGLFAAFLRGTKAAPDREIRRASINSLDRNRKLVQDSPLCGAWCAVSRFYFSGEIETLEKTKPANEGRGSGSQVKISSRKTNLT
jgi:hypothetical protein